MTGSGGQAVSNQSVIGRVSGFPLRGLRSPALSVMIMSVLFRPFRRRDIEGIPCFGFCECGIRRFGNAQWLPAINANKGGSYT